MKPGGLGAHVSAPPAPAPVGRKQRWPERGTRGEFGSLGGIRRGTLDSWLPVDAGEGGCSALAASGGSRSPPSWRAQLGGIIAAGGAGTVLGSRRNSGARLPSSGAPSPPRAGWLSSGFQGLPSSPRLRGALHRPHPRPAHVPPALPWGEQSAPRPAPPRRAHSPLAGDPRVVPAPGQRVSGLRFRLDHPGEAGGGEPAPGGAAGPGPVARAGRGARVRASAGGWARARRVGGDAFAGVGEHSDQTRNE